MLYRAMLFICLLFISLILVACPPIDSVPPTTSSGTPTESPTLTVVPITTATSLSATETPKPTTQQVKVQIRGVGLAPKDETDPARRKRAAIRAAEVEADRAFAQWQSGAQLESNTIIIDSTVDEDTIRETMKASLRMLRNTIEEHFDETTGEAEIVVEYTAEVSQ